VPYESLVARAAAAEDLDPALAQRLTQTYGQLRPWPEAPRVLAAIAAAMPIGTVTNCSDELGHQAADLVGVPFEVTVTAQSAGSYKPQPEPYRQALKALAFAGRTGLVRGRVAIRHPRRRAGRHGCVVAQPGRHACPPRAQPDRRASLARPAPGFCVLAAVRLLHCDLRCDDAPRDGDAAAELAEPPARRHGWRR